MINLLSMWQVQILRWILRIGSVLAILAGIYEKEATPFLFGVPLLMIDLWVTQEEMRLAAKGVRGAVLGAAEKIDNALQYEYLPAASLIWDKAKHLLQSASGNDEILSTASTPNERDFERLIFEKAASAPLTYKRLVCYADPGTGIAHRFPSPDSIAGASAADVLARYFEWYSSFCVAWEAETKREHSSEIDNIGMSFWHQALERVASWTENRFEVRRHGATLPSDYFILNPHQGSHWKAVVGFPRKQREGMGSGIGITLSPLAKDLGKNWERLWDQAPQKALNSPAMVASHRP